ncbi:MAG: hypothetical protein K0R00_14 [Herbinix sp.]|nr:hypothetical protein [Herbinix sp.]
MNQEDFSISQFTSSTAVYLLNAIAETIEFEMGEEDAIDHIVEAFNKLATVIERKNVNISDFQNDNNFILQTAKDLIVLINDENPYAVIKEKYNNLRDEYITSFGNSFISMNRKDLENLGFAFWQPSEPLMLIPIWAYRLLPTDLELTSINGDKAIAFNPIIRVDRSSDIRFGHLGWGFYLRKE